MSDFFVTLEENLVGPFYEFLIVCPTPQPAVHVHGQEPLTASMLAAAPPQEQKQMLGKVK